MLQVMRTTTNGPPPMDHHPEIPNGEHELCTSCEPWFYVAVFLECANSDLCTTTDIKWIINITKLSSQFGSRNHSMFSTRTSLVVNPTRLIPHLSISLHFEPMSQCHNPRRLKRNACGECAANSTGEDPQRAMKQYIISSPVHTFHTPSLRNEMVQLVGNFQFPLGS